MQCSLKKKKEWLNERNRRGRETKMPHGQTDREGQTG